MAIAQFIVLITAFLATAGLIVLLRPLLRRHLMVQPNARSSHADPTPQGAGIAVILAVAAALGAYIALAADQAAALADLLALGIAVLAMTAVGVIDDLIGVPVLARLSLQAIAVAAVLSTTPLPPELRVLPLVPPAAERGIEFLAGLWLVNLVNFMDGIDLMTVAETIAISGSIFVFSLLGAVPQMTGAVALALCGAMFGFAPFNRPVAALFLGDAGSLPVGLILFWLLLQLAAGGHVAAALLLPLYYVADATVTLFWRLARGDNPMQAHRLHFYQVAKERGMPVLKIVGAVAAVNFLLAVLAGASLAAASPWVDAAALASGAVAVAALLARLGRGQWAGFW